MRLNDRDAQLLAKYGNCDLVATLVKLLTARRTNLSGERVDCFKLYLLNAKACEPPSALRASFTPGARFRVNMGVVMAYVGDCLLGFAAKPSQVDSGSVHVDEEFVNRTSMGLVPRCSAVFHDALREQSPENVRLNQ